MKHHQPPLQLVEWKLGPTIAGHKLAFHERGHQIAIDGQPITFTPGEYALCRAAALQCQNELQLEKPMVVALRDPSEPKLSTLFQFEKRVPLVSYAQLLQETQTRSLRQVKRWAYNVNQKIRRTGLSLLHVRRYGYMLGTPPQQS